MDNPSLATMSTYFSLPIKSSATSSLKPNSNLNPYEKHKQLMRRYQAIKPTVKSTVTDLDILRKSHKFLRDDEKESQMSWEDRLAKKYYDKLFKEYCLGDFSRYKTGVVGLRWRSKEECVDGKGQFSCGNLKCTNIKDLSSWEVNFAYLEHGEKKTALVKIRLCSECSYKLNYKKIKAEKKSRKKRKAENDLEEHRADKKLLVTSSSIVEEKIAEEESKNDLQVSNDDGEDEQDDNIWTMPLKLEHNEEKSKEQEMDEFLVDLFA